MMSANATTPERPQLILDEVETTATESIAHELRNALGVVSAAGQLLLEHSDDADLRDQCIEKILAATQRASSIVESLLRFAHPQDGRVRTINVHTVLEDALRSLARLMTLGKISLVKRFQPDLPMVHGDPNLLEQVLINLILNACNAMPQGGALTIATLQTETDEVEIRLIGTAVGILRDDLKVSGSLFAIGPTVREPGADLSISHSIIKQYQGTIEVEHHGGEETTFVVRLPAYVG